MHAPVSIVKSVEASPIIINQIIETTVVDGRETNSQSSKPLRLRVERRVEDFLVQLQDEKDLRFHYSEHINETKFKKLEHDWKLSNVTMDDFFQDQFAGLIEGAVIKCIVSRSEGKCTLELETRQMMFVIKMAMDLAVVAGEELIQHLINTVHRQNAKLVKGSAQLKTMREHEKDNRRLKQENKELERKIEDLTSKLSSSEAKCDKLEKELMDVKNDHDMTKDNLEEAENDLENAREELREAIDDYEELKREFDHLKKDKRSLEDNVERLRRDLESANTENDAIQRDLDQANHIIKKYCAPRNYSNPTPASVSDSKLRELEEAGREKDSLIEQLKKQNSDIQQKSEQAAESVKEAQEKLELTNRALLASETARKAAEDKAKTMMAMLKKQQNTAAANTPRRVLPPQIGMPSTSRAPFQPFQQMNPYSPQFDYSKMTFNNSPLLARPGPVPTLAPSYVTGASVTPNLNRYAHQNSHISPLSGPSTPAMPAVPPSIVGPSGLSLTPILDRAIRDKENAVPPSNRIH